MLFSVVEHRAWVADLVRYLRDERTTPPTMDTHRCPFGQWMEAYGRQRYPDHPALKRAEGLHERIHQRAEALVTSKQRDQIGQTSFLMGEIQALHEELLEGIQQLLEP